MSTTPSPTVLKPATRTVSIGYPEIAGKTGFLHWEVNGQGHVWTDYATGVTTERAVPVGYSSVINTSSDVIAYPGGDTGEIQLVDAVSGGERTMRLPKGFTLRVMRGDTALATGLSAEGKSECHLFRLDGTALTDRKVTGVPSDAPCTSVDAAAAGTGDSTSVAVRYQVASVWHFGLIDLDTAALTELPLPQGAQNLQVTKDYISWYDVVARAVNILPRADLQAAPRTLPNTTAYGTRSFLVGDRVLMMNVGGGVLAAIEPSGATSVALHAVPADRAMAGPDGSLIAVGTGPSGDYAVHRFTAGADGAPVRTEPYPIPWLPSHSERFSLTAGRIDSYEADPHGTQIAFYDRKLALSGPPTVETAGSLGLDVTYQAACRTSQGCPEIHSTVDGRVVYATLESSGPRLHVVDTAHKAPGLQRDLGTTWLTIDSVSSHYVTYATGTATASRTEVRDLDTLDVVRTGPAGATALWGNTLWQAGTGGGLTATSLVTGAVTRTLATGSSCTVSTLQASARHLYWECGTKPDSAGTVDLSTGKAAAIGAGYTPGRIGDGFVARLDGDRKVSITDLTGAAGPVERLLGGTAASSVPGVGWAADPYSALVAYEGEDQSLSVVPTGVAAAPLAQIDATVPTTLNVDNYPGWSPRWWISKPADSWTLTLANKATGTTVSTLTGGEARGLITASWDGIPSAGHPVPNGTYTWTLTARPADGQGASLVKSGSLALRGGAAVRRDANGDGVGDLLTMNGSGGLTYQLFNGAGKLSGGLSGTGWPTSAYAVPFGDFNGDRCNDVLVRFTSGELRSYKPGCGKAVTPSTPYVKVGASGWQQYDVLTSPGDANGDGLADLIARQTSTGDIYFYAGRSDGKFAARVRIFTNWKVYGQIAGVGDITGDGKVDLIGHDKAGGLWRYNGLGNGKFAARVKVFSSWGTSYNAIVGVGDVTGDGKADLVERDTAGNLFRNDGNGKGSFGGRTLISSAYKGYKSLF
ncbi:FG-GAP-like repeat-containing protein [Streptomyces sp. NPDC050738]|uniref:FG-GAP-like repeat-containing protein n=1 Tax=Streptomyces sp. NPDC050738 TaxID=3154744 RepID=UPI003439C4BB